MLTISCLNYCDFCLPIGPWLIDTVLFTEMGNTGGEAGMEKINPTLDTLDPRCLWDIPTALSGRKLIILGV